MKVQCYHFTKNGTSASLAEKVSRHFQLKCDKIPPSFQPDHEAVVFIMTEPDSQPESALIKFLNTITKDKTKTIAFAMVGTSTKGLDKIKAAVNDEDITIHDEVFTCGFQKKLFKGKSISDEDVQNCIKWMDKIIESMHA